MTSDCQFTASYGDIIFRAIVIIHTQEAFIQSLFAIQILHANGISLIEADREENNFFSVE